VSPSPATPHPVFRQGNFLAATGIAIAAIAAYSGSFHGPFLYDDIGSIPRNLTIRHLWPIWAPLMPPPGGYTVSGRPLVNLSLALNYALGGLDVRGYHAVNLAIHILAALTLLGVVRRTLDRVRPTTAPLNLWTAFTIALLWAVHPLQTESVTLIIQRAESLMGLFYLLTLYFFIRSVDAAPIGLETHLRLPIPGLFEAGPGSGTPATSDKLPTGFEGSTQVSGLRFQVFAVAACFCCAATKEVAATAPFLVLLYDRTFVSGSFTGALRRRRGFYAGLASSWILLAYLVLGAGGRAGTAGFGAGVPWWAYALTQFKGVAHYLRLSIWPYPLVADYGRTLGGPTLGLIGDAAVVLGLLALTVKGVMSQLLNSRSELMVKGVAPLLVNSPDKLTSRMVKGVAPLLVNSPDKLTSSGATPLLGFYALFGFAGAWFFLILAPSSSVVPIVTEIIAEHRMYLSLAAVIAVVVIGGCEMAKGVRAPGVKKTGVFL